MAATATIQPGKRHGKGSAPGRPFVPVEPHTRRAIGRIAESGCPVLIVGEPGVGKRSIAAQIHIQPTHARADLIEIPSAEADAEAIITALSSRGTVYLAEIGDLSLGLQ